MKPPNENGASHNVPFSQTETSTTHNYQNGSVASSLAVEDFLRGLEQARAMFGTTHAMDAARVQQWLQFYEEKYRLYDSLCVALPQVKRIPEFWRTAQHLKGDELARFLFREVEMVGKCDCCGMALRNGKRFCHGCADARIQASKEKFKMKALQAHRLCKCGESLKPRRRLCDSCQSTARRLTFARSKDKKRVLNATVNY